MIRFDIISAVPDLLRSPFEHSILKRAISRKLIEVKVHNLREYGIGKHKQIDDYAYGGGAGMVMQVEPIFNILTALQKTRSYDEVIYLCPDGQRFEQKMANKLSLKNNLIFLCGHYKGVDERIREHMITMEISIGDYVLSGAELAAAVVVDATARLLPGVLNDETSALTDSFQDDLIAPPVFSRPEEFNGWKVPGVLLSGNDKMIQEWREEQSILRTKERRPELLDD